MKCSVKKKKINKFMILVFLIILIVSRIDLNSVMAEKKIQSQNGEFELKNLTQAEKLEDFNYLYNILIENFPYFNIEKEKWDYDWISKKEYFKNKIKNTSSNKEFYIAMSEVLNSLQNIHTDIIHPKNFESTKEVYLSTKFEKWKSILKNEKVNNKYCDWKQILDENYNSDDEYEIPLNFYYVEGSYISYNSGYDKSLLKVNNGDELLEVDGKSVDDYVKSRIEKDRLKYDYLREKMYMDCINFKDNSEFSMLLKIKDSSGDIKEVNIKSNKILKDSIKSLNNNLKVKSEQNLTLKKIQNDDIAYLKVKSFHYSNVEKDKLKIYNFLKEVKDYKNLIIDIRGNGGGADLYWSDNIVKPLIKDKKSYSYTCIYRDGQYIKPFIEERVGKSMDTFKNKESLVRDKNIDSVLKDIGNGFSSYQKFDYVVAPGEESIDFKGQIYILVDSDVYSAAESFCVFSKQTNFAKIVGEVTGGDGIGIDPIILTLPNSSLAVRFPAEVGVSKDNTINERTHTKPDILIEQSKKDFVSKMDFMFKSEFFKYNKFDTVLNDTINMCK